VKNGFSPKMTSHERATYFKRCVAAFWYRRYLHWLSITLWSRVRPIIISKAKIVASAGVKDI